MPDLSAADVKAFVPAKDFSVSLDFYLEMGWKKNFASEDLAELELAEARIYLQNFYNKDWANNFMLHIMVADAGAWHAHLSEIVKNTKYAPARVKAPKEQDYGALVCFAWDPSGVLLHFAQMLK